MVANILLFNPKGMAAKGAGAPAERGDRLRHLRHRPHRGKVVATYIGRRANHYRFALRTSSDMHPHTTIGLYHERVVVCIHFTIGLHLFFPQAHMLPPSAPRRTPRRKG